jgi:hypothetical protein
LFPLTLPILVLALVSGCGTGGGYDDEDDLCQAIVAALGSNDPTRLVALLPHDDAQRSLFLAKAWEEADAGDTKIRDEEIQRFVLGQAEVEWGARTTERTVASARKAQRLARHLDRIRDLMDKPRSRELKFRRFRETGNTLRYGDRDLAEAEILTGTLRLQHEEKDEEFICEVKLAEVNRTWFLLDLMDCHETYP